MYHTSNWISNPKGSVINKHDRESSAKIAQWKDETSVTVMKQHLVVLMLRCRTHCNLRPVPNTAA